MNLQDELNIPLDDFEYDELESFLLMLESPEALLNMSEFDGFITALVSGPDAVPPGEWLPLVWGGDARAAGLESPEDVERIGRLMIRHLNTTALTLAEDPEAFEPWFMENEVDGRVFLVVDDWCIGYMRAVMLRQAQWEKNGTDVVELLSPIPLFTSDEGWALLDQLADRHVEYLQNQVAAAALDAHAYWRGRRQDFQVPEGARVH
ncbi:MAG: UPF0149 family protein [Xanthomonadales bacterium]|jgi:uncharacterized protein|nr:UPF0149 family protein [Xanthomonadales bacterium]